MTTTHSSAHDLAAATARPRTSDPVRRVLAVDAGVCIAAGAALLATASTVAERADLASPSAVQVIGAFLLVLGVDLALFAKAPTRWARLGAAVTAVGDVGWVAGSVLLAATAGLPAWATAGVLGQAVVTLGMAVAKRTALRSTTR